MASLEQRVHDLERAVLELQQQHMLDDRLKAALAERDASAEAAAARGRDVVEHRWTFREKLVGGICAGLVALNQLSSLIGPWVHTR